jgi:hypothetical protein
MQNIQIIEKQNGNYRLLINGIECLFIPLDLFTTGLMPVKRTQVNNSLGWYVNRKFVSYKQIKKAIINKKPGAMNSNRAQKI